MISVSACLQRRATDQLGPLESARPALSYTTCRDIIRTQDGPRCDLTKPRAFNLDKQLILRQPKCTNTKALLGVVPQGSGFKFA